jgi:polysaccharide biosynthesis/export protein
MNRKTILLAFTLVVGLLSTLAVAQARVDAPVMPAQSPASGAQPVVHPTLSGTASPADLVIGDGDLLEVGIFGVPDFKSDVRVSSNGNVSLPIVGDVWVAGLTIEQAEKRIEQKLVEAKLFNDPHVSVFEKEYATQGVSILGEVQRPGMYPLLGSHNLFDAISVAGGTTPKAGSYVLLTHRNDPQHPQRIPLTTGTGESGDNNVKVEPGDTILVSKAGIVYVVGDVHQPGGFVMENGKSITVLEAIALAQGTNPNASLNGAKLIRSTPEGPKETPLQLKDILAAKAVDPKLQADDVVFVPGSASKSAAKRGAEAILTMATGVAVWRVP